MKKLRRNEYPALIGFLFFLAMFLAACATSPTGRKQFIVVSDGQMNQMGTQAFQEMKAQTPPETDPAINNYVVCVTRPIAQVSASKLGVEQWEVVVFKDPTPNAFALPGGKIGVHTGLLPVARTPEQLAAVLGHEVGHVIARHSAERASQEFAGSAGLAALQAFASGGSAATAGQPSTLGKVIGVLGGPALQLGVLMPFGRTQESEADLIGLDLMAKAGFDPKQSVALWRNMMAASKGKAPPEFLSTHPASENRIKNLEAHLPEAQAKYDRARASGKAPNCKAPSI